MGTIELDHAVGPATTVLLDTSVLIAYYTVHERVHGLSTHVLSRVEDDADALEAWCSTVSLMELLVRPTRAGTDRADAMLTSITRFPHLHLVPVDIVVAKQAAALRAHHAISPPDALVVATGLTSGCTVFLSNDDAWHRRLSAHHPDARFLYLDSFV